MHGVEETAEDQNVSTEDQHVVEDQRKLENEAEPELITDIRNRDPGICFVLFLLLFVCSFLKVEGGGIFSLVTCPLHFFFFKMSSKSPLQVLYDCVIIIDFRRFICHRASSRTVVRASVLELGG